jgi:hypothetical protein
VTNHVRLPPCLLLQMLVVLPLAGISQLGPEGAGLAEDTLDAFVMLRNRPTLAVLLLAYTGALQGYNLCGMVAGGALHKANSTAQQINEE